MPSPWGRAVALAALLCSLAGASANQVPPLLTVTKTAVGGVPVLRAEAPPSSLPRFIGDDGLSAVISSNGVRYVSPGQLSERRHPEIVREAQNFVQNVKAPPEEKQGDLPEYKHGDVPAVTGRAKSPNAAYFGVGTATFLCALGLMLVVMRKFNYLTEPEGLLGQQDNPQGEEDEPVAHSPSGNPEHPGNNVEHRMQQVLVAWMFIVASFSFCLDYLALQASFANACHWFGMVAMILWLLGFLVHFHWQLSIGENFTIMVAAFFKVAACIMMQVHPFMMIMGRKESDMEVWWPAFAGLALWHLGNVIGVTNVTMYPPTGTNASKGFMAYGNLAITEMWIDLMATTLLMVASVCTTQWGGNPEAQLVATANGVVAFCQFGGAAMFLLAACVKCEWCNGFRNCSHQAPPDASASASSSSADPRLIS